MSISMIGRLNADAVTLAEDFVLVVRNSGSIFPFCLNPGIQIQNYG